MSKPLLNKYFAWATVIMLAFIIYGSLFPFNFHSRGEGAHPLAKLLSTWKFRPEHFGNLIGNVFLYVPFGLFGLLAIGNRIKVIVRLGLVAVAAAALCFSMEITQFYVVGRVSTFADIYPNVLGAILGGMAGLATGTDLRWPLKSALHIQPIPILLLSSFLAYRLFPYVPSLDLHQYWQALKPVVLHPHFGYYDIARYTVMWLLVATLGQTVVGGARMRLLLAPAMLCVLSAQVAITHNNVTAPEVVGVAIAFPFWLVLSRTSTRTQPTTLAAALAAFVIAERLQPFDFLASAQAFGWIPFRSFMQGSMAINTQSFLEKFFLYGGLIWLQTRAGARLAMAGLTVALGLLATSFLQTHLAGRSAEITDAAMALVIAGLFALITRTVASSDPVQEPSDRAPF